MWKFYLIAILALSGCSHFTFNKQMCTQIASEPNSVLPQECLPYIDEDAKKAFDNINKKLGTSNEDAIEFKIKNKEK